MVEDIVVYLKIKGGDEKAFESLFYKYYAPLCKYAALIIGSYDEAEEIVQELFYKLWRDRESVSINYSINNYLYRSVRNMAMEYCDKQTVRMRYMQSEASKDEPMLFSVESDIECSELKRLLDRVICKLPPRCKKIFAMNRFQGKRYCDIASELSLSVKTIEADMSKVLKILKKEVECYGK